MTDLSKAAVDINNKLCKISKVIATWQANEVDDFEALKLIREIAFCPVVTLPLTK